MEQLCWSCKNTSPTRCEWFRDTSKHPKYCTVNKDNFIVKCKQFEKLDNVSSAKEKEKELGISLRSYYRKMELYNQKSKKIEEEERE